MRPGAGWSWTSPNTAATGAASRGMRHGQWFTGPYFAVYGQGGGKGTVAQWQQAMGIDWTDVRRELAEAIPPAYTQWIGRQSALQLFGQTLGRAA